MEQEAKMINAICTEFGISELALNDREFAELCSLVEKGTSREKQLVRWHVASLLTIIGGIFGTVASGRMANPQNPAFLGLSAFSAVCGKLGTAFTNNALRMLRRDIQLGIQQIIDDLHRDPRRLHILLESSPEIGHEWKRGGESNTI